MISRDSYFTHPGVSQSQLRDLARSPMHYHARHIAKTAPMEETDGLLFGRLVHATTLEPETVPGAFVVQDWDARTKVGKACRDEALASGATIVDAEDMDRAWAMAEAVRNHPLAARILAARTHTEHPIEWEDPTTGILCKGKPDACVELGGRRSLVDLKSCISADPESFSRSIATHGYHLQAAQYLDGWSAAVAQVESFVFLAVEKSAPYAVAVYELDAEAIERGRAKRAQLLDLLATCRAENRWPGYAPQSIGLPRWAIRD